MKMVYLLFILPVIYLTLCTTPLQFDELLVLNAISRVEWSHLPKFLIESEVQMPLQYLLIKFLYLFSDTVWFLRLPSIILSSLLPLLIFFYSRLDYNYRTSLIAALMNAISLPILVYSYSLRPYILLIFTFYLSLYYLRKNFLTLNKKAHYNISNSLLFFSHPVGTILSYLLDIFFIIKQKGKSSLLLFILLSKSAAFSYFLFFRREIFEILLNTSFSFEGPFIFLKKSSFLFSGAPFLFVLFTAAFFIWRSENNREPIFHPQKLNNNILIFTWLISALSCLVWEKFIHARYLIFCVPLIFFITLDQISILRKTTQNILILSIFISLIVKAFVIDQIHKIPHDLDSKNIALKMQEVSEDNLPMINCGNCLSYYIKSPTLECIGPSYQASKLRSITGKFLYLELDFVKNVCGLQHMDRRILKLNQWDYKGGTIYLLDRSPLQVNPTNPVAN